MEPITERPSAHVTFPSILRTLSKRINSSSHNGGQMTHIALSSPGAPPRHVTRGGEGGAAREPHTGGYALSETWRVCVLWPPLPLLPCTTSP